MVNAKTGDLGLNDTFNGESIQTVLPIQGSDGRIVLLNFEASPSDRDFRNLTRCDSAGNIVWVADLPVTGANAYVDVSWSDGRLIARSWSGHRVNLDPETGAILEITITK